MTNDDTPLLRQIVEKWIVAGRPSSQAFRPMSGDELSTYDGDLISGEDSYEHYTNVLGNSSSGVASAKVITFRSEDLEIIEDRQPYVQHITVKYSSMQSSSKRKIVSRKIAETSKWEYRPED